MTCRDWLIAVSRLLAALAAALLLYLLLWPVRIVPRAWDPKPNPDLTGPYVPNDGLASAAFISVHSDGHHGVGPETIAVGPDGWLYTGLCDAQPVDPPYIEDPALCDLNAPRAGQIVRIHPQTRAVQPYASTGGRPLGLAFDGAGRLYVADAYEGLLRIEQRGDHRAVVRVASCVDRGHPGAHPLYTDSLYIARDGAVWFTCPSQRFGLEDIRSDGLETQRTGRLLRYDPRTGEKTVKLDQLAFANGVTMPPSERFVLVNEWYGYRITRLWLSGPKQGKVDTFVENTPGYPDNIVADGDRFWVGMVIRRMPLIDALHSRPFWMRMIARIPERLQPQPQRYAFLVAYDASGRLVQNLQDGSGHLSQVTGAYRAGDSLYLGSNSDEYVTRIRVPGTKQTDVTARASRTVKP
jgi:hypothetical protein